MVLRPRFVRHAFLFHEYICKSTGAVFDPAYGRYRATKRTWEHFLWFVSKLDVLQSDEVDFEHIVMPPDHIIGSRKNEILTPPDRRKSGRFLKPQLPAELQPSINTAAFCCVR